MNVMLKLWEEMKDAEERGNIDRSDRLAAIYSEVCTLCDELKSAHATLGFISHYVPDGFARQSVNSMLGHSGAVTTISGQHAARLGEFITTKRLR
jgi:hypothetical protein